MHGEAFECYFDNSTEENVPNEEARSFQKIKPALLEKLSTGKTGAEVMTSAMLVTLLFIQQLQRVTSRIRKFVCLVTQAWASNTIEEVLIHAASCVTLRALH